MRWVLAPYERYLFRGGAPARRCALRPLILQQPGRPAPWTELELRDGSGTIALVTEGVDVALGARGVDALPDLPLTGRLGDASASDRAMLLDLLRSTGLSAAAIKQALGADTSAARMLAVVDALTATTPVPAVDANGEIVVDASRRVARARPIPGLAAGAAFPTTSILSTFTGSNGSTPAGMSDNPTADLDSGLRIQDNQGTAGSGVYAGSWWSVTPYGPASEAWMTLATRPSPNNRFSAVFLRLQSPGTSGVDGYLVYVEKLSGTDRVAVERITNQSYTSVGADISQEFSGGDSFGASMIDSTITVYRQPSAGSWGALGTRTDATYGGVGYIGWESDDTTSRIDNAGGGTVVTGVDPIEEPIDPASETDSALPVAITLGLPQAPATTDTARPLGIALGLPTPGTTDQALPLGIRLGVTPATEATTALPLGGAPDIGTPIEPAEETDVALPLGIRLGLTPAAETTSARPLGTGETPPPPPPVVVVPPARALWRWEIVTHAGVPLAELPATGRRLTLARNAGGDARFALPLSIPEPLRSLLVLGQVDLLVSRRGRRLWRGPIMGADVELDTETGAATFSAVSIWETIAHRVIPAGYEILATEATQAAWQLIADAQDGPGRDLGIVAGDLPDSVARSRTWDTPATMAAGVEELAALEDGFDWSLTPQQPADGDGWRWDAWYPRQGNELDLVLEWGRNVTRVSARADGTRVRSRATVRTSNQIAVTAEDLTSAGLYREREVDISAGDVDDAGVLADRAAGALVPAPVWVPRLHLTPGLVTLDDIGIGDSVPVRVRHGWLQIVGRYRIEQIEVEITDEGQEQLIVIPQEGDAES